MSESKTPAALLAVADQVKGIVLGLYGIDIQYRADGNWGVDCPGPSYRWRVHLMSAKHDNLRLTVYGETMEEGINALDYQVKIERERWRRNPDYYPGGTK